MEIMCSCKTLLGNICEITTSELIFGKFYLFGTTVQLSHWRVATLHAFWGSLQLAEAATKQLRATALVPEG